jgi:serine/threonine protein kinase
LVYYRYGGFDSEFIQTQLGEITPAIVTPSGELVPDRRTGVYTPPQWVNDPFLAAGITTAPTSTTFTRRIADRYYILASLSQTPRGAVYLALNLTNANRCVLKRANRSATISLHGFGAQERLNHEAQILNLLSDDLRFPYSYELFEHQGDMFLVMEDIEGETLELFIMKRRIEGNLCSSQEVVKMGHQLVVLLATLHSKGLVYHDLKSPNVIVTPDQQLRLIDFELCQAINSLEKSFGFGTRGYMSPQQATGEVASVSDDIYSLGALLYFIATGIEPSHAPDPFSLLSRPPELLNPTLNPKLVQLIATCLEPKVSNRFQSMLAVDAALTEISEELDQLTSSLPRFELAETASAEKDQDQKVSQRYLGLARRLGETLCKVAQPLPNGKGVAWLSKHLFSAGILSRDINSGSAGPVLALAELVAETDDPQFKAVLQAGVQGLASISRPKGPPLVGLYVGEAGTGAAILRAGQVLADPTMLLQAEERGHWVATVPYNSPDLFNGSAGRLRFHLWLWDATGDQAHLQAALAAGDSLVAAATQTEEGDIYWVIPDGYESMSGKAFMGYAHGAAGIADALLDLFEASGESRFQNTALSACKWIAKQAIPVLKDGVGLDWPTSAADSKDKTPASGMWCYGAAGIGRLFLHAGTSGWLAQATEIAERAALATSACARWACPVQCHGLAGNIEFLLDMFQATGKRSYLIEAQTLGKLLEAFATEQNGLLVWPSETPGVFTPDYMVGYAGVLVCLLRLANPSRLPNQLSRKGFSYLPH